MLKDSGIVSLVDLICWEVGGVDIGGELRFERCTNCA